MKCVRTTSDLSRRFADRCSQRLALACLPAAVVLGLLAGRALADKYVEPPEAARVTEIEAILPMRPLGVGRPIDDREAWQKIAHAEQFSGAVAAARKIAETPVPELSDELYLDFSKTGNRTRYQRALGRRLGRLPVLVVAECLENRGGFIDAIEREILATCKMKSWLLPAHDRSLRNFRGEAVEIDLMAAHVGWTLATTDYWLGSELDPKVRQTMRDELDRRIVRPYLACVREGEPRLWWIRGTNNWNAVCLAGVTGTALAVVPDRRQRAFFVASAEKYIKNFLRGFTPDGYCSEGIGYWNYGYGHFIMLAETLHQNTEGKLSLFELQGAKSAAEFCRKIEILPGVYPAFADCTVGSEPQEEWMAYLSRKLGWGLRGLELTALGTEADPHRRLYALGLLCFPNSATATPPVEPSEAKRSARDWFPDAGVLICRPGSDGRLGAAMKGGHNAEHHNHNDVGTFVVALGDDTPLVDPGAEVYTARTFSSKRYESDVLNSFGHPVPVVAGKLQQKGRKSAAKVLKTEFTDKADTIALQLKDAYPVATLESLERTFRFSREGAGSLTVTDEFAFSEPATFATALVTFGPWRAESDNVLIVGEGGQAVRVGIDTDGAAFVLEDTKIKEDVRGGRLPTRLGIALREPAAKGRIRLTIAPE